jgi:VIT1/CCC1 family predicted Fe2+/Mn2+ transporter
VSGPDCLRACIRAVPSLCWARHDLAMSLCAPAPPVPQDLANPLQACVTSMIAFSLGALVPLLSGAFIDDHNERVALVTVASTVALAMFGAFGAWAGGSGKLMGAMRVVLGGLLAMGVTYAVGAGFKIAMEA